MYRDIWYQLFLFVVFFMAGTVFAFVYDAVKVSGRFVPANSFFSVLKDVFFWIISTIFIFALCLKFNDGEIRFFMLAGVFLGALVYFNTISRAVILVLGFVADVVKKVFLFVFRLIFMPVRLLLKLVNKPVFVAVSFTKNSFVKLIKKLKFKFLILKKFKR